MGTRNCKTEVTTGRASTWGEELGLAGLAYPGG